MTIMQTLAPPSGWSTGTELPSGLLTCDKCGAACEETATSAHVRWHADVDLRMLPLFAEFVTEEQPDDSPIVADLTELTELADRAEVTAADVDVVADVEVADVEMADVEEAGVEVAEVVEEVEVAEVADGEEAAAELTPEVTPAATVIEAPVLFPRFADFMRLDQAEPALAYDDFDAAGDMPLADQLDDSVEVDEVHGTHEAHAISA